MKTSKALGLSRPAAALYLLACAALQAPRSHAGEAVYAVEPQFRLLRFGEVVPTGWIHEQIVRDLRDGFAGHMPEVAPMTCGADIFGSGRNLPDRIQNAGGGSWGGAEGAWWKGETEGNWRSGNTMLSLLSGVPELRALADAARGASPEDPGRRRVHGHLRADAAVVLRGESTTGSCGPRPPSSGASSRTTRPPGARTC